MARLRELQKELTEKIILETAEALFIEKGFDNTKTSAIAKAAGVAEGTLYNYFPSKAGLLIKMISNKIYREDHLFTNKPITKDYSDALKEVLELTNKYWGWTSNVKRNFLRHVFSEMIRSSGINKDHDENALNLDRGYIRQISVILTKYNQEADQIDIQSDILFSVVMTYMQLYSMKDELNVDELWNELAGKFEYLFDSWKY